MSVIVSSFASAARAVSDVVAGIRPEQWEGPGLGEDPDARFSSLVTEAITSPSARTPTSPTPRASPWICLCRLSRRPAHSQR